MALNHEYIYGPKDPENSTRTQISEYPAILKNVPKRAPRRDRENTAQMETRRGENLKQVGH
jgi:hypothetical protein